MELCVIRDKYFSTKHREERGRRKAAAFAKRNVLTKGEIVLLRSIKLSLSIYWRTRKSLLVLCALAVVMRVAAPYLTIFLPKVVIDQIEAQVEPVTFFMTVGGLVLALVVVSYLRAFTDSIANHAIGTTGIGNVIKSVMMKLMRMDYELMEDPDFKAAHEKAERAGMGNGSPAMNIPRTLVELASNVIGFLLYASVIALIHPLILVLLLVTSAINWLMLSRARKYMERTREARSTLNKKISALNDTLRKPEAAKDIRLYNAFGWLSGLYRRQYGEFRTAERKLLAREMQSQLTDGLMILLRDGAAYAFLIYLVLNGRMSLGDFVFIFAAIGALAGWVTGILTAANMLSRSCIEMGDIYAVLNYPDRMNTGKGAALPTAAPSIELRGVGYTYPKAESPALTDVNVTIGAGERIAVVGANGAGKSTLVKLISGLYRPTAGEVLLDGKAVDAYNRDEYYSLFSVVFQEIYMMSSSVAENVAQEVDYDRARVEECLKLAGLDVDMDCLLVRAVNADATELSGGQQQKLAMARAIYKDSPVIILDEPTAALDPLAENEVYRQYAELTENKTSVYISHRLASTRFCDRILLIEGNRIAEQGSHDELMALGGTYAKMFEVQASYYQEEAAV